MVMNNRFSLKKNLFNAVNLSKSFDKSEVILINLEIDINTSNESIEDMTQVLINGLTKCVRKTKIYFITQYLELNGLDTENLSLNYKFILCGKKLNITRYQLRDILIGLLEDESWAEYQVKETSKEDLIVELVPIHLGITNSNVIKKLPQHLFNNLMSDITVITGNQLKNKLNHNSVKIAGKYD
jgi:hypothetical protein